MKKLVIKINDDDYKRIQSISGVFNSLTSTRVYSAIRNGTPLDSIIADIEAARDKDKLCEYPYNRCIDILRRADK